MRRPKPIKPFKSLEEEASFWDTHDISDLIKNPKIPISSLLSLDSKKTSVMTLRVQRSVKERIQKFAKFKGINSATLSRMWLIEKLVEVEEKGSHKKLQGML